MLFLLALALSVIGLSSGSPKLICYWPDDSSGVPEEVIPSLCTHLHYSFAILDENSLTMRWANETLAKNLVARFVKLKKKDPKLKLLLAIGGPDKSRKYSKMAWNKTSRTRFVQTGIKFLEEYRFDGLDLDWEFPVCWEDDCNAGPDADREHFSLLIRELKEEFNKRQPKLLLSSAVKANESLAERAYNFTALGRYLDYISVMTYDNLERRPKKTQHHAGIEWSKKQMNWWTSKGIAKTKLLLGIPFYGRQLTLANPNATVGAPVKNNTRSKYKSFWEICKNVKYNGWNKRLVKEIGDVAYHGDQWVGYDGVETVKSKTEWSRVNGFGGVSIWEITLDDVKSRCCLVDRPLLRAVNFSLFGNSTDPTKYGC